MEKRYKSRQNKEIIIEMLKISMLCVLSYLAVFEVRGHQYVACPEPLVDVSHRVHVLHAQSHLTTEAH